MLKNYFKTAWRNITRNKLFSAINITGLSIGLGCVMLIILYVQDEVSFDRFNENGQRIYQIVHHGRGPEGDEQKGSITGAVHAPMFKQEIPEIQEICRVNSSSGLMKKGTEVISERGMYVDDSFFKVFTFPLVAGNTNTALAEPNNIVLTELLAKKYFGNTNAVGKTLQINVDGKFEPFVVTGVAKQPPLNSTIRFDYVMNITRTFQKQEWKANDWFNTWLNSFILLRPGADRALVEKKMDRVFNSYAGKLMVEFRKQYGNKMYIKYVLQPYLNIHLDKGNYYAGNGLTPNSKSDYSYILGGIALFILIIACINFVNLTLSRSLRRSKEIGIRKVSGSSRGMLIGQFMGESFLLTMLAFMLALVLVSVCLPFFNEVAEKQLQLSYLLNPQTILLFLGLIALNAILSGFYPALVLSGFNPVETLYGKFKIAGNNYLGKVLVVVQLSIAVFLAIGTIIMQKQFNFMLNRDLGYKPENIVNVYMPFNNNPGTDIFKSELGKYPFIKGVAAQNTAFNNFTGRQFKANNKDLFSTQFFDVDNNFINLMRMKLVSGRNFSSTSDTVSCIVNESFVKAAGWKGSPIGETVTWNDKPREVIGVIKDFHSASLQSTIAPLLLDQGVKDNDYYVLVVKIDPAKKAEAIQTIQATYKKIVSDQPCNYAFLTDMLADQYKSEKRWKSIIGTASFISILISCMGLFGLATLSIEQRVKEIGVRKVLGASSAAIVRLLSLSYLKLVLISLVIASPAAWYLMHRWLQDFPYRINMNGWIIALAAAGSIVIVLFTVGSQSIRASMANPVKSLRNE